MGALAIVVSVSPRARADEWLARDKALHFGASAVLAGSGYAAGTAVFDGRDRAASFALGGGVALGAGLAKEGLDAAGLGDPSWKDLAWDVIGTAIGLGVAWGIDLVVRPARSMPTTATHAPLLLRF